MSKFAVDGLKVLVLFLCSAYLLTVLWRQQSSLKIAERFIPILWIQGAAIFCYGVAALVCFVLLLHLQR